MHTGEGEGRYPVGLTPREGAEDLTAEVAAARAEGLRLAHPLTVEPPNDVPPEAAFVAQADGTPAEGSGHRKPRAVPVDWAAIWDTEGAAVEWLCEPLISRGRLTALYSEAKVGKSLLMLEIAAAVATGGVALSRPTSRCRVMYIDLENDPRGDVVQRLKAMGYAAQQLGALLLYSFPDLPPLDTKAGGEELLALALENDVGLVVIDTVSRTVSGEENANDTWLMLYRFTGLLLKRHGIACVRIDHAGKKPGNGQRGGSAKAGDVDAIWRLSASSHNTLRLHCEASRQLIPDDDRDLTILRRFEPLRHERSSSPGADAREARIVHLVAQMDALDVPLDHGRDRVRAALKAAGETATNQELTDAIGRRKTCPRPGSDRSPYLSLSEGPGDGDGQDG
ncbi:AAA family ATPase [Micropruina sp.]|uniref:AAA family ATPase n=1 Tax=Micropruina sp. TaxID=2737536 RepID=UPI0039E28A3C